MNCIKYKSIIGLVLAILCLGCNKDWKDHYNSKAETVNKNVWEAIQKDDNLSLFAEYVKKYNYDTLFLTNNPYTLFVPTNVAFTNYVDSADGTRRLLNYLIAEHFIQSGNIQGKKKIQTLGEKFALFEKTTEGCFFDGVQLKSESPLYLNGKYFTMDEMVYPKLNLYEYYGQTNPILKAFIDDLDTAILDKELSKPLGFDENGNTIYDTVAIVYNLFELEFFPVSKELRYKTATTVFPKEADYNNGLNLMAQSLGGNYHDYRDIPLDWQNKILIPYLLERGVFENMLEESAFVLKPGQDTLKLKNILGDSVAVDYRPCEKVLCSNGYAYNYCNFKVPDTLYAGSQRFEGERLLRNTGINTYAWKDDVTVSPLIFTPMQELIQGASNDSILRVNFSYNYSGNFSVEFNVEFLFPRKYLMIIRTSRNYGGIYDIYVNDVLVKTIDYADFKVGYYWSVTGKRYFPDSKGFINFDCWIDNILTEYSKAKIKFDYKGPGTVLNKGLSIDYIDFKPY